MVSTVKEQVLPMNSYAIRTASPDDAPILRDIYAYYVENTGVTFEYAPPTVEEFRERINSTLPKYPYLVIEDAGEIVGFSFAHAFRERPAYDYSVETTIYIRHDYRGKGCGRAIYTALEDALKKMHITNLYACVGYTEQEDEYLTNASPRFHEHMGYKTNGMFRNCGFKFGRWYSMIWMEKIIGDYPDDPPAIEPYRKG
jgi:phosphinothricin acetyltransferase